MNAVEATYWLQVMLTAGASIVALIYVYQTILPRILSGTRSRDDEVEERLSRLLDHREELPRRRTDGPSTDRGRDASDT